MLGSSIGQNMTPAEREQMKTMFQKQVLYRARVRVGVRVGVRIMARARARARARASR